MMINSMTIDGVALVAMDLPPVNALGVQMRRSLDQELRKAFADEAIGAVLITSDLTLFGGGADIQEFRTGDLWQSPDLTEICALIEAAPKLVIAAINGAAMGGALEMALACDYRIGRAGLSMGLPEIKLGLLPGAGGTQRLPRIAGLKPATEMILSGDPVDAEMALSAGLVDRIVPREADFRQAALHYAAKLVATGARPRRAGDMAVDRRQVAVTFFDDIRSAMARKTRGQVAPARCLQSIEAACVLPLEQGLRQEVDGFRELLATPQSRALRHLFFAERAAKSVPGVTANTPSRPIDAVAVVGAGTMGRGIAIACLEAGIPVTLLETSSEALAHGLVAVAVHFDRAAAKGRLSALPTLCPRRHCKPSTPITNKDPTCAKPSSSPPPARRSAWHLRARSTTSNPPA